jgi:hypothetical protein
VDEVSPANHYGGMASAAPYSLADSNFGVKLLLAGVGVAILAQLWPAVPLCTAIALIAWGTALTVSRRPGLLILAAVVYAPLSILAVMAQVDLAMQSSLAWGLVAGFDAALAITLLYSLARKTGELLAALR